LTAEVPTQARAAIDLTMGSPGTYIPEEGVYKRLLCRDQNNNMSIGVPKAEERRDLIAYFKEQKGELKCEEVRMSDWLGDVIGDDLIAVYEGLYFTEDALLWLREKPRTFGELRAEEIDWLRWMAANVRDEDILEKLSEDPDTDVRMWVACNPVTPEPTLEKLAEDPIVFVRRGVAQNRSTPTPVLLRLNDDTDLAVRALVSRNCNNRSRRSRERRAPGSEASQYSGWHRRD
jgi:hypothetical protein